MSAKLKSALKNHKKVVDKNVPLNRLVLRARKWRVEPVLKGVADNFKDEKCHFIRFRATADILRGAAALR